MKTTLLLNKVEFLELLKKIVPTEFMPKKPFDLDFQVHGYPVKEYEITMEEKEE